MDKVRTFLRKEWHILVMIALIVIVSYPALFMVMAKGHDLDFHLMRAEGIRQDLSWSQIPVRMQSNWIDGYGYPVSILYGDLFLYLLAFFRVCGMAIMPAYRLFVVCVNTATTVIAFNSFKIIFKKKEPALVSTVLYVTAAYRLVDEYVRSAVGETLTIVFLPAVVACIYMIYTGEEACIRRRASVILAITLTAITCAHTLTTSMLGIVIAPGFIAGLFVFCKKGDRLKRFFDLVIAGLITGLLAAFFIVPFLDFYMNAGIGFALENGENIQGEGLTVFDMFDFFCNPFRSDSTNDIQKTPGIVLMAVLIAALIYIVVCLAKKVRSKNYKRIVFVTVFAVCLMFMTSRYFPWNFIENNVPFGGIFTAIEFPMRYMAFVIVFLAMLSGDMFMLLGGKRIITGVLSIAAILCVFNVVNLCFYNAWFEKKALFMETEDLGRWDYYAMDFQLKNSTVDDLDLGIKQEGLLSMEVVSRDSNDWMIACVSGPEYGWIQLPMFAYPYYYACDVEDPSKVFEIHEGANRTVGVLLPGNYSGILHVYWREPLFWKVCEIISLITFIGCMAYLVRGSVKGIKKEVSA